jgi:hypothetical protein
MKPGPKPSGIKMQQIVLRIPEEVLKEVELLLFNPLRGKPKKGARSLLVETLLRGWLIEQRKDIVVLKKEDLE